jgi:two-component system, NtrC family, response regulator AtoC
MAMECALSDIDQHGALDLMQDQAAHVTNKKRADGAWPDTNPLTDSALLSAASAPSSRLGLLVCHRDGAEMLPLHEGVSVTVGRAPPCELTIEDSGLSRRHTRFTLEGDEVVVEDLGSLNGTLVDGKRIDRAKVRPGDTVQLATVTAAVHALPSPVLVRSRLLGHAKFLAILEAELQRARFFGRGLAVGMARALGTVRSVHTFVDGLHQALRPVDVAALYSADTVEFLLPEATEREAVALTQAIRREAGGAAVGFGIAIVSQPLSADRAIEQCRGALQRATRERPVEVVTLDAAATIADSAAPGAPVAVSASMAQVLKTADRLARGVIPVLLLGETGTGKEVVARYIHQRSPRRERPLICLNCGAIPAQLVESVLFGHERGAFTGAAAQKKGLFEAAHGGSLLLDEIGELSAAAQATLLRVIETKRVTRVGSNAELPVDVRIMAATHRDLETMAESGAFRQDLLYRLNALVLRIPPLRERAEDIEPLAKSFLASANEANGCNVEGIDPDARELLLGHAWPGNARELRNVIERATVIAESGMITPEDLPANIGPAVQSDHTDDGGDLDFRSRIEKAEVDVIVAALEREGGNQTRAARRLSLPLRTLQYKIKVLGIERPGRGKRS